jgi:vacuolar iron transporter family protein
MEPTHPEQHFSQRVGWLRAAVLGANDGILSTASLLVGVASASVAPADVLIAGLAGMVAGAMSMAAGEYVSVSSQADTIKADLQRERRELATNYAYERKELAAIYEKRGLQPDLAQLVADQLMEKDALAAHARDEIGISSTQKARPMQASVTSALAFSIGASLPLVVAWLAPVNGLVPAVAGSSLLALAALGAWGARMGGANLLVGAVRVLSWGALAMVATSLVGTLIGGG